MAKLKFGSIVTEGSGSLGGHTIQLSKGGMQLRNKPIPRGNPSPAQTLIRSYNPVLQAGWRALTSAQQKIWNDWPVSHGIMNAKGDKHPLSGHSLWMKYQFGRLVVELPFMTNPSQYRLNYFGPELILNGTFLNSDHWTVESSWLIAAGKASYDTITTNRIYTPAVLTPGSTYQLEFDCITSFIAYMLMYMVPVIGELFAPPYNAWNAFANGHNKIYPVCIAPASVIAFYGGSNTTPFSIDNLSLKQLL